MKQKYSPALRRQAGPCSKIETLLRFWFAYRIKLRLHDGAWPRLRCAVESLGQDRPYAGLTGGLPANHRRAHVRSKGSGMTIFLHRMLLFHKSSLGPKVNLVNGTITVFPNLA